MMDAVRILLKRMDTNPEEFTRDGRWASIITIYKDLIPEDEIELLDIKLNEIRTKQFTAAVLEQLMQDKNMNESVSGLDTTVYKTKNRYLIEQLK